MTYDKCISSIAFSTSRVLGLSEGSGNGLLGESGLPLAIWLSERRICLEDIDVANV